MDLRAVSVTKSARQHFHSAMNIADYYRIRASELRREAEDTLDANVKQSKLETAEAFERLIALARERRPRSAGAAQTAAVDASRER